MKESSIKKCEGRASKLVADISNLGKKLNIVLWR
jgi:hypothetical protein